MSQISDLNINVNTLVLPIEEAKKLGAMALFGEKYGAVVRVVDMGVSKEFCGGTHVANTAEIEKYAIYSFESIGSGIFRITAATGANAMDTLKANVANIEANLNSTLARAKEIILEAKKENIQLTFDYDQRDINVFGYRYILALRREVAKAQEALKQLDKEYQSLKSQNALKQLDKFDSLIKNDMLFALTDAADTNLIKDMATALRNNKNLKVVVLAHADDAKVTFVAATKEGYDASAIVKEATKITGGGGGGKKDLAQAGGKDPSKTMDALKHLEETIK